MNTFMVIFQTALEANLAQRCKDKLIKKEKHDCETAKQRIAKLVKQCKMLNDFHVYAMTFFQIAFEAKSMCNPNFAELET